MSSTNYKVEADILNMGGGHSTSTNYALEDSLGDIATGEGISSTNYGLCAGYECFKQSPYIAFTVKEGTSSPGTAGAGVNLGTVSVYVTGSNNTTINSIYLTAESNAPFGSAVTVRDQNAALASVAIPANKIDSADATLADSGPAGYGVCVTSTNQDSGSPSNLTAASPYNGTCNTGAGHQVGGLTQAAQTIVSSTAELKGGTAEILVKAVATTVTPAMSDYQDVLTFIMTSTY